VRCGGLAGARRRPGAGRAHPLSIDLTPPDSPIRAVKVLAPGLEVETASHGRIGERNLQRLLDRDLGLVGFGPSPPGAARIHRSAGAEPARLHRRRLDALVGDLYALYREPSRHATMRIGARQT
jgi:hypothetical protein